MENKMTEIPKDIMDTAWAILETEGEKLIPIAKAIFAERERWLASDEAGRESGLMLDPLDLSNAVRAERKRCERVVEEAWQAIRTGG